MRPVIPKLTKQQIAKVIKLKLEGKRSSEIRDTLNVSETHIARAWSDYRKSNPSVQPRPTRSR